MLFIFGFIRCVPPSYPWLRRLMLIVTANWTVVKKVCQSHQFRSSDSHLPDTRAVQLWTRLTRATSSWGETMKVTRPRRMSARPERREREWSEGRGEESEARSELEGRNRPEDDRSDTEPSVEELRCGAL